MPQLKVSAIASAVGMSQAQQNKFCKAVGKLRQLQALSPGKPIHVSVGNSVDRGRHRENGSDGRGNCRGHNSLWYPRFTCIAFYQCSVREQFNASLSSTV